MSETGIDIPITELLKSQKRPSPIYSPDLSENPSNNGQKAKKDYKGFIRRHESATGKTTHLLSEAGKREIKEQISKKGFVDTLGYLDEKGLQDWISELKKTYQDIDYDKRSDEQRFNYLTVRSLEMRLRRSGQIDAAESVKVSNSPWKKVAARIGQLPEYQQKFKSEISRTAFIEEMLSPVGQIVFEEVRSFTDDALERDLIFYTLADGLVTEMDLDRLSQNPDLFPQDGKPVTGKFKKIILAAMGEDVSSATATETLNELLRRRINNLVLKARLDAEQPEFILRQMKSDLSRMQSADEDGMLP